MMWFLELVLHGFGNLQLDEFWKKLNRLQLPFLYLKGWLTCGETGFWTPLPIGRDNFPLTLYFSILTKLTTLTEKAKRILSIKNFKISNYLQQSIY